jgi:hypothetical protein
MLRLDFDTSGLTSQVDKLRQTIADSVRPAAQAAAQVYYDEMRLRAGAIKDSGILSQSIFQKYVKERSLDGYSARYHISWNKGKGRATPVAFHGQLLEYGWLQRYASYLDKKGQWWTAVRPEMRGKPRPKRNASQAVKDAYYVLRKGGPIQHAPRSFLRATYEAKNTEAVKAAEKELQERILKAFI